MTPCLWHKAGSSVVWQRKNRCADYILRDRPHTINIFLFGDMKSKTKRVIAEYGISPARAPGKITQVDKFRKEHYFHYTGRQWGDSRNYHATLSRYI